MIRFLGRRLRLMVADGGISIEKMSIHLGFLRKGTFFISRSVTSYRNNEEKKSFVVSYLIDSCGLSSKSAKVVAKYLDFKTSERADSVLNLFKNQGFTNAQISKVIRSFPKVLITNPETTLAKFEFFFSIGASRTDVAKIFCSNPVFLSRSIKYHFVPFYNFLKSVVLFDENVIKALKNMRRSINSRLEDTMMPNLMLLKEIGVSQKCIRCLVTHYSNIAMNKHYRFRRAVGVVREFGFEPSKVAFVKAICVVSALKKSSWDSRIEVYGRWGLSKDQTLSAFRKIPECMLISEEKLNRVMELLVTKMGWPVELIARNPLVLLYSFDNRTLPRCCVAQVLLSKGLFKEDLCISTFLMIGEKYFLKKYVTKYEQSVPELLDLYKKKLTRKSLENPCNGLTGIV